MSRKELAARPGWEAISPERVTLCGLAAIFGSTKSKKPGRAKYEASLLGYGERFGGETKWFDRLGNAVRWCEEKLLERVRPIAEVKQTSAVVAWEPESNTRLIEI